MVPRPRGPELRRQRPERVDGGLADRVNLVLQPLDAVPAELLLKGRGAQLLCQSRHVLDDGHAHAPVLVLGQVLDGGQEGLREQLDAHHLIDLAQAGDHVQAHVGDLRGRTEEGGGKNRYDVIREGELGKDGGG